MTNKDAIELIEDIRPKKCKEVNGRLQGGYPDHDSDVGKAIDMAIEALEKQIPKKPKHIGELDIDSNAEVECECFATQDVAIKTIKRVHCWRCGQLLDWSENYDK